MHSTGSVHKWTIEIEECIVVNNCDFIQRPLSQSTLVKIMWRRQASEPPRDATYGCKIPAQKTH
jgi:hypothetical protein